MNEPKSPTTVVAHFVCWVGLVIAGTAAGAALSLVHGGRWHTTGALLAIGICIYATGRFVLATEEE